MKDLNILEQLKEDVLIVGRHIYIKEGDCAYVAKPNATGELNIFEINKESLERSVHPVKNPTLEQKENALLNHILDDNKNNPSKRGIYSIGIGKLYYEYLDAISDVKYERIDDTDLINRFALNADDLVVKNLAKSIIEGYTKKDEKLLTK